MAIGFYVVVTCDRNAYARTMALEDVCQFLLTSSSFHCSPVKVQLQNEMKCFIISAKTERVQLLSACCVWDTNMENKQCDVLTTKKMKEKKIYSWAIWCVVIVFFPPSIFLQQAHKVQVNYLSFAKREAFTAHSKVYHHKRVVAHTKHIFKKRIKHVNQLAIIMYRQTSHSVFFLSHADNTRTICAKRRP